MILFTMSGQAQIKAHVQRPMNLVMSGTDPRYRCGVVGQVSRSRDPYRRRPAVDALRRAVLSGSKEKLRSRAKLGIELTSWLVIAFISTAVFLAGFRVRVLVTCTQESVRAIPSWLSTICSSRVSRFTSSSKVLRWSAYCSTSSTPASLPLIRGPHQVTAVPVAADRTSQFLPSWEPYLFPKTRCRSN